MYVAFYINVMKSSIRYKDDGTALKSSRDKFSPHSLGLTVCALRVSSVSLVMHFAVNNFSLLLPGSRILSAIPEALLQKIIKEFHCITSANFFPRPSSSFSWQLTGMLFLLGNNEVGIPKPWKEKPRKPVASKDYYINFSKLTSVFHASVLLLIMTFVIKLSK